MTLSECYRSFARRPTSQRNTANTSMVHRDQWPLYMTLLAFFAQVIKSSQSDEDLDRDVADYVKQYGPLIPAQYAQQAAAVTEYLGYYVRLAPSRDGQLFKLCFGGAQIPPNFSIKSSTSSDGKRWVATTSLN